MDAPLVEPTEAVAHVVAHDLRAPLFMAAELLQATAAEVADADEGGISDELRRRLHVVVEGLREACRTADALVDELRPERRTGQVPATAVEDRARQAWPDTDVDARIDRERTVPALWVDVVGDLARAVPAPSSVRLEIGRTMRCRVTVPEAPTRPGSLALARIARSVSTSLEGGGDVRLARADGQVTVDVRSGEGAEHR